MATSAQTIALPQRVALTDVRKDRDGVQGFITREWLARLQLLANLQPTVAAIQAQIDEIERGLNLTQCIIETKYAEAADTLQYTAPAGMRVLIDGFAAYNVNAAAQTLTVSLVPSGAVAGPEHVIANPSILTGETYTFPELAGQALEPGDSIRTLASAATAITIRSSGSPVAT